MCFLVNYTLNVNPKVRWTTKYTTRKEAERDIHKYKNVCTIQPYKGTRWYLHDDGELHNSYLHTIEFSKDPPF